MSNYFRCSVFFFILSLFYSGHLSDCSDIHELSHDFSLKRIDPKQIQNLQAQFDTSISFQFQKEKRPNTTVKYFLSKPWRLRFAEFDGLIHRPDVRILHHSSQIQFDRVRLIHQGVYSLYQFYFETYRKPRKKQRKSTSGNHYHRHYHHDHGNDEEFKEQNSRHPQHDGDSGDLFDDVIDDSNDVVDYVDDDWNQINHHQRLIHFTRRDFNLVVNGLKKEREFCHDNSECESGSCPSFYCVCNSNRPIFLDESNICIESKNYNDSCMNDLQCRWNGGPLAECYQHNDWSRCRCQKQSVPIRISYTTQQIYCVNLAQLHQPCLFSKQCTLVGINRYCNSSYRCDCLPGYHLEQVSYEPDRCVISSALSTIINQRITSQSMAASILFLFVLLSFFYGR